MVENFVCRRVSCIVLAPHDNKALVAPVETAVHGRIPVVIIDSCLASTLHSSLVATNNREGSRIADRNLGKILGGSRNEILLRYAVVSKSTEEREAGFLEVMKADLAGIKLLSTDQHAGLHATAPSV